MALPLTNISFQDIMTEFRGDPEIEFTEYYLGGDYVPPNQKGYGGVAIPSSGAIDVGVFRGAILQSISGNGSFTATPHGFGTRASTPGTDGNAAVMFRTTDGTNTWTYLSTNYGYSFSLVGPPIAGDFGDQYTLGYILHYQGVWLHVCSYGTLKSTNNGVTWSVLDTSANGYVEIAQMVSTFMFASRSKLQTTNFTTSYCTTKTPSSCPGWIMTNYVSYSYDLATVNSTSSQVKFNEIKYNSTTGQCSCTGTTNIDNVTYGLNAVKGTTRLMLKIVGSLCYVYKTIIGGSPTETISTPVNSGYQPINLMYTTNYLGYDPVLDLFVLICKNPYSDPATSLHVGSGVSVWTSTNGDTWTFRSSNTSANISSATGLSMSTSTIPYYINGGTVLLVNPFGTIPTIAQAKSTNFGSSWTGGSASVTTTNGAAYTAACTTARTMVVVTSRYSSVITL
jgi:hypothetical protein